MFTDDEVMVAKIYEGNVKALKNYGYDGVKIDSCSEFLNMSRWSATMKAEGLTILTENCHNSDGQDPCMNSKVRETLTRALKPLTRHIPPTLLCNMLSVAWSGRCVPLRPTVRTTSGGRVLTSTQVGIPSSVTCRVRSRGREIRRWLDQGGGPIQTW
jgi:hypothetical protein